VKTALVTGRGPACAFFISAEAGYSTGQILGVNGGRHT
jgi:hypothetical protein